MIKTTSKTNFSTSEEIPAKIISPKNAKRITTAMFIKLLATRIVANNFLGRSKSFEIIMIRLSVCSSSKTDLDKEKKATSAPEINAEKNNRINSNIKLKTSENTEKSIVKNENNNLVGSGSNVIFLN